MMNHSEINKFFIMPLILVVQIWVLRVHFFLQFLVSSVDLRNFEDPDPGSQNLVDPSDPDPKHC